MKKPKNIKEVLSYRGKKMATARWKKTTKEERREISKKMHEARYGDKPKENGKI
jgi:hypothetical protein